LGSVKNAQGQVKVKGERENKLMAEPPMTRNQKEFWKNGTDITNDHSEKHHKGNKMEVRRKKIGSRKGYLRTSQTKKATRRNIKNQHDFLREGSNASEEEGAGAKGEKKREQHGQSEKSGPPTHQNCTRARRTKRRATPGTRGKEIQP